MLPSEHSSSSPINIYLKVDFTSIMLFICVRSICKSQTGNEMKLCLKNTKRYL